MKRLILAAAMLFVSLALGARLAHAQITITPGTDAAAKLRLLAVVGTQDMAEPTARLT